MNARFTLTRDIYTANLKNAVKITAKNSDAVAYLFSNTNGKPAAMVFHGKAGKPDWHYSFQNEQHRERRVREYFEGRAARAASMAKYKAERNAPHTLKVGDVLYTSWGYNATNVDFYVVTALVGDKMVELTACASREVSTGRDGHSGQVVAEPSKLKGAPMRKKANGDNSIRVNSFSSATPWDGRAMSWNSD